MHNIDVHHLIVEGGFIRLRNESEWGRVVTKPKPKDMMVTAEYLFGDTWDEFECPISEVVEFKPPPKKIKRNAKSGSKETTVDGLPPETKAQPADALVVQNSHVNGNLPGQWGQFAPGDVVEDARGHIYLVKSLRRTRWEVMTENGKVYSATAGSLRKSNKPFRMPTEGNTVMVGSIVTARVPRVYGADVELVVIGFKGTDNNIAKCVKLGGDPNAKYSSINHVVSNLEVVTR